MATVSIVVGGSATTTVHINERFVPMRDGKGSLPDVASGKNAVTWNMIGGPNDDMTLDVIVGGTKIKSFADSISNLPNTNSEAGFGWIMVP